MLCQDPAIQARSAFGARDLVHATPAQNGYRIAPQADKTQECAQTNNDTSLPKESKHVGPCYHLSHVVVVIIAKKTTAFLLHLLEEETNGTRVKKILSTQALVRL